MSLLRLRRRLVVWLPASIVLPVALLLALSPRDPRYAGRPLNFWLNCLPVTTGCTNGEFSRRLPGVRAYCYEKAVEGHERLLVMSETAERAVSYFGPRCLPSLALSLHAADTPIMQLRERLWWGAMKYRVWRRYRVLHEAVAERGQALTATSELGVAARPLLPELTAMARHDPDAGLRAAALEVVRRLAPADYGRIIAEAAPANAGPLLTNGMRQAGSSY